MRSPRSAISTRRSRPSRRGRGGTRRALEDPSALLAWARSLARTGKHEEAADAYRALLPRGAVLSTTTRVSAEIEAGLVAMQRGERGLDEAAASLRGAVHEAQDEAQAVAALGLALALDRAGSGREARALLAERGHGDPREAVATPRARELLAVAPGETHAIAALALEASDGVGREGRVAARDRRSAARALGGARARSTSPRSQGSGRERGRDDDRSRTLRGSRAGGAPFFRPSRASQADTPPDAWDLARDPSVRVRWDLHVRVQQLLDGVLDGAPAEGLGAVSGLPLAAARAELEGAGAASSPDIRLRFDLGIVYQRLASIEERDDLYEAATRVLAPALAMAPNHPAAVRAFEALTAAYDRLDRPAEEVASTRQYIDRVEDGRVRAVGLMDMGEAEMRLGHVDDALATFRDVLQICAATSGTIVTYALTQWDLAVALDRSGDARSALETAAKARQVSWEVEGPHGPTEARHRMGRDPGPRRRVLRAGVGEAVVPGARRCGGGPGREGPESEHGPLGERRAALGVVRRPGLGGE